MEFMPTNINPLDIDQILIQVLGYLKSPDLRRCRAVNSTWNQFAVAGLRRQGQLMTLANENISSYLQFLLYCTDRKQEVHALNIHLKISVPTCSEIYKMVGDCLKIQEFIGRPCFVSFEYGHSGAGDGVDDVRDWEKAKAGSANVAPNPAVKVGLWQFLQLISPTLALIHFHGQLCRSPPMKSELNTCLPHFSFPALRSIHYEANTINMYEIHRDPLGLFSVALLQIIASSPVLDKLSLMMASPPVGSRWINHHNNGHTINGILSRINPDAFGRICSLKISVLDVQTANTLIRFQFPRLRELEVHQSINCLVRPTFRTFLHRNCPSILRQNFVNRSDISGVAIPNGLLGNRGMYNYRGQTRRGRARNYDPGYPDDSRGYEVFGED